MKILSTNIEIKWHDSIAVTNTTRMVMLKITRKAGEAFFIFPEDLPEDMTVKELFAGGRISVEVLSVHEGHVKIGIDAPQDLTILRDDVGERKE